MFLPLLLFTLFFNAALFFSQADTDEQRLGRLSSQDRLQAVRFGDGALMEVQATEAMVTTLETLNDGALELMNRYPRHYALILFMLFHEHFVSVFGDRGETDNNGLNGRNCPLVALLLDLELMPDRYAPEEGTGELEVLKEDWREYRARYGRLAWREEATAVTIPRLLRPLFAFDVPITEQQTASFACLKRVFLGYVEHYLEPISLQNQREVVFEQSELGRLRSMRVEAAFGLVVLTPFRMMVEALRNSRMVGQKEDQRQPFPNPFKKQNAFSEEDRQVQAVPVEQQHRGTEAPSSTPAPVAENRVTAFESFSLLTTTPPPPPPSSQPPPTSPPSLPPLAPSASSLSSSSSSSSSLSSPSSLSPSVSSVKMSQSERMEVSDGEEGEAKVKKEKSCAAREGSTTEAEGETETDAEDEPEVELSRPQPFILKASGLRSQITLGQLPERFSSESDNSNSSKRDTG